MRQYETAFLISPNMPEEEVEKFILQMAEIVSKKKGKMIKQDIWGKRKLAYPIQKFEEAVYVFFDYEGEPDISTELERRFKQTESVMRYLTVRKEVKKIVRKKKRKTRAEEEPPVLEEEKVEETDVDQEEPPDKEPAEKEE
ncbi:MAG: 30S ribosomal protein S6 [Candidatus Aminicenantes bacterium]|nr:MAG: 30S ribosomal protein S6 [Candidatus Aminicenantes bacterium]